MVGHVIEVDSHSFHLQELDSFYSYLDKLGLWHLSVQSDSINTALLGGFIDLCYYKLIKIEDFALVTQLSKLFGKLFAQIHFYSMPNFWLQKTCMIIQILCLYTFFFVLLVLKVVHSTY